MKTKISIVAGADGVDLKISISDATEEDASEIIKAIRNFQKKADGK